MDAVITVDEDRLLTELQFRELVRARAGWKCQCCGTEARLTAHHKDCDHKNHRLRNGECLCNSCHVKLHMAEERAKKSREKAWKTRREKYGPSGQPQAWHDAMKVGASARALKAWDTRRAMEVTS